jgi:hypothetical protein
MLCTARHTFKSPIDLAAPMPSVDLGFDVGPLSIKQLQVFEEGSISE